MNSAAVENILRTLSLIGPCALHMENGNPLPCPHCMARWIHRVGTAFAATDFVASGNTVSMSRDDFERIRRVVSEPIQMMIPRN